MSSSWKLQKLMRLLFTYITYSLLVSGAGASDGVFMPEVDYEEVQRLMKSPTPPRFIDVREPSELKEFGEYQGAVNVPLGQLKDALQMSNDDEFRRLYGFPKPDKLTTTLIFACHSGRRSGLASQLASDLGYTRVKNYKGSWIDYHERAGLPLKRIDGSGIPQK